MYASDIKQMAAGLGKFLKTLTPYEAWDDETKLRLAEGEKARNQRFRKEIAIEKNRRGTPDHTENELLWPSC